MLYYLVKDMAGVKTWKMLILDEAEKDLVNGYRFYERQSFGLGDYFLDSLSSDIDSLRFYGGIHAKH